MAGLLATGVRVSAQDMEPRAYSASPVGANFLVVVASRSTGSVLVDPTLPVTDVHADINGFALGLGHTFNLFGKLGLASVALPYAVANVSGRVMENAAEIHRSGLADSRLKLSVNLLGNDAMSPREFVGAPARTVIGASVAVSAPSSQVQRHETHQPWHEPLEHQTGSRRGGAVGAVGSRRIFRRHVLHEQHGFLSGRCHAIAGSSPVDPGTRQLHHPVPALDRGRRYVYTEAAR